MEKKEYKNYLHSKEWKKKRFEKLKKNPCCERCEARLHLHIHHGTYDNLGDENIDDLFTLCKMCHKDIHRYHRRRRKRMTLFEATKELISETSWERREVTIVTDEIKKQRSSNKAVDKLFLPVTLKVSKIPIRKKRKPPCEYLS